MVLSLVLASCAPAVTEEEEEAALPEEEVVTEEEEVALGPEVPKYGGVFNFCISEPLLGLDEAISYPWATYTLNFTNEELVSGDWAKGPAGTGEAGWLIAGTFFLPLSTGIVAESWEIPDTGTFIFHIRKGIHFHDKPPVNGRELNADDVVYSLNRLYELPTSYLNYCYPVGNLLRPTSITAPDKWTVVVKYPIIEAKRDMGHHDFQRIVPREMVEEWGDLQDWRASCGTGPFMLVDYVPGSSATLKRNPNYWRKDPLHPENTLPYLDGINMLIVTDPSTRLAGLRTGKLDYLPAISWEEAANFMKTNPELGQLKSLPNAYCIHMRTDNSELPFDDIRVRRALAMAIDNPAIVEDFYGGSAELLTHPLQPCPEFVNIFTPLEELSESTRKLYEYHPDEARQLLAEAGYPDGFETKIVCYQDHVPILSIVKDYWAKIGVDLEINVKEYGVWKSICTGSAHEEMIYDVHATDCSGAVNRLKEDRWENLSIISDQRQIETVALIDQYRGDWPELQKVWKEFIPYFLDKCWIIETPTPYQYTMWQPWVQNYHGEFSVGYYNFYNFVNYIWLDTNLKKSMGY